MTGYSLFELETENKPLMPQVIVTKDIGSNMATMEFLKKWKEMLDLTKTHLEKAAKCMNKWEYK